MWIYLTSLAIKGLFLQCIHDLPPFLIMGLKSCFSILPKRVDIISIMRVSVYIYMCLCVHVCCSHGSPSRSAAHSPTRSCAPTPGVSLCWLPQTQRGSCCWMVRSCLIDIYLPMSSKIKPAIHIYSILHSAECHGRQLT